MVKLQTSLIWPGCAQGKYMVKAKGFFLAILQWGDDAGPLKEWGPFAYVPIDPAGNGCFFFPGKRGIPRAATRVWARCVAPDFSTCADASCELPPRYLSAAETSRSFTRFSILTDLHLAAKPWKIRQALRAAESDILFLLGDSTNDGLAEQFEGFETCIADTIPDKTVFPVAGNHDVLHASRENGADGCRNYEAFQSRLLSRAEGFGHAVSLAPDGRAYAAQIDEIDVVGLQCVTVGRKFLFPEGKQLDWLEAHLSQTKAAWHIILCHAPLIRHNPNRNEGAPYLDKDKRLQELIDRTGRIIFLSGHTHVSPNVPSGGGAFDEARQNVYLDCGSAVATDTSGESGMMAPDWKDGCETELLVKEDEIEIRMRSIVSGINFPRGYYRFRVSD